MILKITKEKKQQGAMLIYLIIIIFIFIIVMLPIINIVSTKMQLLRSTADREQALQIAESGINYYQWHLAHFQNDYKDGTNQPGPYVHDYIDIDTQKNIGKFSLTITPPLIGSTIVTIQSTGWTNNNPSATRTITVKYGIPSLAQYSLLANDGIAVYFTDEAFSGRIQSNNGIRFDATGNAPIQSAKSTYTCPSWQGDSCPTIKDGVWGSAPQSTKNFWQFPVPAIDFSSLTSDLAVMKSTAQSGGIYLPPSNKNGYSLVFNSNETVSVYKVKTLKSNSCGGMDGYYITHNECIDYNARDFQFTQAIPSNGIIYIEDKTWVEGTVKGRATIAAAKLPYNASTAPTIYIPNNIIYSAKDGSNVLGLVAQKDIVITRNAPNNLEIDAALIAQNGLAEFFYFPGVIKNTLTIFGTVMNFGYWFDNFVWTSGYTNNVVSGYSESVYNYDSNLLYAPPPYFPLSASGYELLNWTSN
ncbi:MAG: hypothetical protein AAB352_04105 [Patescibacteria group bacterium]